MVRQGMCAAAAFTILAALAAPAVAFESTVDVFFMAPYSSVADSLDEFTQQFNVMLQRTGAVTADDITSAVPKSTDDGNILVTVTLSSLEAAIKVTGAVEDRHLSVYIDGKGYIAVIPKSVPMTTDPTATTDPDATTQPTTTRATTVATTTVPTTFNPNATTTEHPSLKGFVWLNEYTSDIENLDDCSTGGDWSGVVISRMPIGCHRFTHAQTKQDEYNWLSLENGASNHFGMVCDPQCKSCISQVEDFAYGGCSATWGGSVSITTQSDDPCIGATYLDTSEGTISVFKYSTAGCDLMANPATTLYIRNYPDVPMNAQATCTRDGTTDTFYKLTRVADEKGAVFYNGMLGCSDDECSVGCTAVQSWQENSCNRAADGTGMRIANANNALSECVSNVEEQHIAHIDSADVSSTEEPITTTTAPVNNTTNNITTSTTRAPIVNTTTRAPLTLPASTTQAPAVQDESQGGANNKAEPENKELLAVMIAVGGVMAVAFLMAGILHTRKLRQREIEANVYDDDEDLYDEYDYNGYSKYDAAEEWDDDRLVTDI